MNDETMIVTPEQFSEGYKEAQHSNPQFPPIIYARDFRKIQTLPDGNILVENPNYRQKGVK